MLCLFHAAHVRAERCLIDICEAELLQCRLEHVRRHLRSELSRKRWSYLCNDGSAGLHGTDQLENLRFIRDCAERTAHHAHAAGDAHLLINTRPADLVRFDGIYAACRLAGTFLVTDGIVRTYLLTLSALDTFLLVDDGFPVLHGNRTARAHTLAGMRKAAHAGACHLVTVLGTGIARGRNYLHQRRLIILLVNITLLQPLCQVSRMLSVLRTQTHSHGKPDSLTDNCTVAVHTLPILGFFIIYDLVGKRLHVILQVGRVVGKICYLLEHSSSPLPYRGVYPSHTAHLSLPPFPCAPYQYTQC